MTWLRSLLRLVRAWLPLLGLMAFAGSSLFIVELDYRRGVAALEETLVAGAVGAQLASGTADLERAVHRAVQERLSDVRRRHVALLGAWAGFLIVSLAGLTGIRLAGKRARIERHRAERARRAAERKYASLERLAAVGILRVDERGTVREATPWWGRTMGLVGGEGVGKAWWIVFAERERELGAALWREHAAEGGAFAQEVRLVDGEGRQRWLAGRWQPETECTIGKRGWVGAFVDVTEQRLLENQAQQARKLDAVGRLTRGLSHDFNNLLSVILSNTHLLLMDAGDRDPEEREILADIDRAAKSGRDVVKRLMSFSRRGDLDLVPSDLSSTVAEAADLARRLLPPGYRLEVSAPRPGPVVHADARAVEQIVLNLVSNARDAMEAGGRIRVTVDGVLADAEFRGDRPWVEPGRYGCLTVSDDGAGMDDATMEQIFEPLFTTKAEGKGAGLGLSTVHGLMGQHGGHVRVYSEPGVGTTFQLYFPEVAGAANPATPARPPHGAGDPASGDGSLSVLLVDDDESLRRTSTRLLVRLGYRVLEAQDGEEALGVLDGPEGSVDLILSDLSMAGMDGLELFRRIEERGDAPPFVFTSGTSPQDMEGSAALPEGTRFLPKPWGAEQFIKLVDQLGLRAG